MKKILLLICIQGLLFINFEEAMQKLSKLEDYIREYAKEKICNYHEKYDIKDDKIKELLTNYLREVVFNDGAWSFIGWGKPFIIRFLYKEYKKKKKIQMSET